MEQKIGNIVNTLMSLYASSHYYHWMTTSEAEHNTMEDLYEGMNKIMDDFVEAMQGRYKIRVKTPSALTIVPYKMRVEFISNTIKDLDKFIMGCDSEDLKNKAAEMIELLNITLYRLTLK